MDNDKLYLEHILASIQKIKRFCADQSFESFLRDDMAQSAVIRELEIIGEAAKKVSEKLKDENPEILWKQIMGTRDKLIHNYMSVDIYLVWDIAENHLGVLEGQMERLLGHYSENV